MGGYNSRYTKEENIKNWDFDLVEGGRRKGQFALYLNRVGGVEITTTLQNAFTM
jgi:hypothetical protein